jgi:hypothetical protein
MSGNAESRERIGRVDGTTTTMDTFHHNFTERTVANTGINNFPKRSNTLREDEKQENTAMLIRGCEHLDRGVRVQVMSCRNQPDNLIYKRIKPNDYASTSQRMRRQFRTKRITLVKEQRIHGNTLNCTST